jgi:hypothetical protein
VTDDQGRDTFYRRPQAGYRLHKFIHGNVEPFKNDSSVGICVTRALRLTIDFLIVLQICEMVKAHFAMKRHMRPTDASEAATVEILEGILNAPVPSVGENQLLLVKHSRLESAHISVSGKTMSA